MSGSGAGGGASTFFDMKAETESPFDKALRHDDLFHTARTEAQRKVAGLLALFGADVSHTVGRSFESLIEEHCETVVFFRTAVALETRTVAATSAELDRTRQSRDGLAEHVRALADELDRRPSKRGLPVIAAAREALAESIGERP